MPKLIETVYKLWSHWWIRLSSKLDCMTTRSESFSILSKLDCITSRSATCKMVGCSAVKVNVTNNPQALAICKDAQSLQIHSWSLLQVLRFFVFNYSLFNLLVLTSVKNDTWGFASTSGIPFNYITVVNGGTYRCWHQGGCDRPYLSGTIVENPYDPQIQGFLG